MESTSFGEMTLAEHLAELRTRLVRIFLAVFAGGVVGWLVFDPIFDFITRPYCDIPGAYRGAAGECQLIVTQVFEAFGVRIRTAIVVGLFIAAPVLFHQIWGFVTPGLTRRERRYTLPFVSLSMVMFALGGAFAFLVVPMGLRFMLGLGGEHIATLLSAGDYFTFILRMIVLFGLAFEAPLLIVFLALIGVVDAAKLRSFRPYAVVLNTVVAAIITPADVVSMLFLAVPLVILYEAAVMATWLIERSRRRAVTEEPTS